MSTVAALVLFAAITMYAVFGGADFGAGFWDLVAGRTEPGERPREVIDHSIAPVWEANHVWLIFVFVLLWTCFPEAYASITLTLFVPLTIAAFGIVLRGASFAFRKAVLRTRDRRNFGAAFAVSSVLVPYCFGAVVGSIASGRVPSGGKAGDPWASWVNPTSVLGGVLAVCVTAYLAAFFLVSDARRLSDEAMVAYFRRRAVAAASRRRAGVARGDLRAGRRRDVPLRRAHVTGASAGDPLRRLRGRRPRAAPAADRGRCAPGRRGRRGQRRRGMGRGPVGLPASPDADGVLGGRAIRDDHGGPGGRRAGRGPPPPGASACSTCSTRGRCCPRRACPSPRRPFRDPGKAAMSDPLSTWTDGVAKDAIVNFVSRVRGDGHTAPVPEEERVAVFDNDGTLWCEKPMPIQLDFILRRLADHGSRAARAPRTAALASRLRA